MRLTLLVVLMVMCGLATMSRPVAAMALPMPEVKVMCSGAFYSTMEILASIYEKKSGQKIILISGSSMGASPTSIPARLKRGEDADIVIMAGSELDKLINDGLVARGSREDLVLSKIGMAVKAGAPKPDISTSESFVATLLNAKSIGYSASASGTYLWETLFPRLGIRDQIKDKTKLVVKDRVATWVARGDLEIGFQQVSELLPIQGVDYVGTIPEEYQQVTVFSAGIAAGSIRIDEAEQLIRFVRSAEVSQIILKQGLEPVSQ